jgi:hypothetical protein
MLLVSALEQALPNDQYRASSPSNPSPSFNTGGIMKTYEAYVRTQPSNMVMKTQVQADSNQAALFLLQGMYGAHNIVHLPTLVS